MKRAYFLMCLVLGSLLRSARYSKARIVFQDGERRVEKFRAFYAPLLIWMSTPLVRLLDTGVVILPQHEWEDRERRLYESLYRTSVRTGANRTLVLPYLAGETLATLLEDPNLDEPRRARAIERAVAALAEFHRLGLTHGDAMAENVIVDLHAGVARWFDFETVHESSRPMDWRRADDVRALLSTCLLRTAPGKRAGTLELIIAVYADDDVADRVAASFATVFRRPLAFHLAQAPLSFQCFNEIARLLQ